MTDASSRCAASKSSRPPDLDPPQAQWILQEIQKADERDLRLNPLRLVRHPRRGIIPLAPFKKQQQYIDLYRQVRKVAGWDGPNRAGKSMAASMICAETLTGWPIEGWPSLPWDVRRVPLGPPRHIGCVTVGMSKSIEGQQKAIADLIPRVLLACKPWNERTGFGGETPRLVLRNGSLVTFLSDHMRQERFEQFPFDLVWIDEAVKQWVFDRLIARLIDTAGKFLITAVAEAAWIFRVLRMRVMRSDSLEPVSQELVNTIADSTIYDNELLEQSAIADSISLWGGADSREARMRAGGEYVHLEGVVFPEFDNITSVEPTVAPPAHWTRYEWQDPGYANPYAIALAAVSPDGVIHIYAEIYLRHERVPAVAGALKGLRKRYTPSPDSPLGYREPFRSVMDEAGEARQHRGVPIPSYREEMLREGIFTVPARHPPGSVAAGNQKIAALLKRGHLKIQAHCKWARFEFMSYKYEDPDEDTGEFLGDKETPVDAHNHLISAIRYGVSDDPVYVPLQAAEPPRHTVAHDLWEIEQQRRAAADQLWE